jgi:DNA polymerase-3 subunit delta'
MIYSWQIKHWNRLLGQPGRIPHALLLSGPQGGGKAEFTQALAARLLCETAQDAALACGQCVSCKLFSGGNHPDYRGIFPGSDESDDADSDTEVGPAKKKSDQIRISQIRALDELIGIGTHRSGKRVILIQPAEAMNPATANSLLKVLEEPSPSTIFILITNNKRRLLPTVLSRCRVLSFPKPAASQALDCLHATGVKHVEELLAHAGGMPLAAIEEANQWGRMNEFFQDLSNIGRAGPVVIAGRWETWLKEGKEADIALDKRTLVTWLQKWVFDLILVKRCGKAFYHSHLLQEVRNAAAGASIAALFDCYNDLLRIKAVSQHPLNPRLFIEDILSRYARAATSGR